MTFHIMTKTDSETGNTKYFKMKYETHYEAELIKFFLNTRQTSSFDKLRLRKRSTASFHLLLPSHEQKITPPPKKIIYKNNNVHQVWCARCGSARSLRSSLSLLLLLGRVRGETHTHTHSVGGRVGVSVWFT